METDFYRSIRGTEFLYNRQPLEHGREITYTINDARAKHYVSVVQGETGKITLLNPSVVAPRPYGFFLEEAFFQHPSLVKTIQETLVKQQIEGALEKLKPLWLTYIRRDGNLPSVSALRNFDPPNHDPVSKEALVQFGVRTFGWIVRHIPNVLLIHNFNYGELAQKFELTERLMEVDRQIVAYDMRKRVPAGTSEREVQSWYLYPHMTEKWSLKGHGIYARLVADLLTEQNLLAQKKRK